MSQHRRMTSTAAAGGAGDAVREAHSVSLKVLRLSKPSLALQHPLQTGIASGNAPAPAIKPSASRAYPVPDDDDDARRASERSSGSGSVGVTPLLALPPAFGSAYVGETFSCTLCVNNELGALSSLAGWDVGGADKELAGEEKHISAIHIEAEMKTPGGSIPLELGAGHGTAEDGKENRGEGDILDTNDVLLRGHSVQRIVSYRLLQEGNHVLAVTVRYTETTASKGRVRTFRKLYQFVAKGCMVVRTKTSRMPDESVQSDDQRIRRRRQGKRRWVLEAQLENCGEETLCLQTVTLDTTTGLRSAALNWTVLPEDDHDSDLAASRRAPKPILNPKDVEQVCFLVDQIGEDDALETTGKAASGGGDGRVTLGQLSIGWTSAMGNEGVLLTGWLSTKLM